MDGSAFHKLVLVLCLHCYKTSSLAEMSQTTLLEQGSGSRNEKVVSFFIPCSVLDLLAEAANKDAN